MAKHRIQGSRLRGRKESLFEVFAHPGPTAHWDFCPSFWAELKLCTFRKSSENPPSQLLSSLRARLLYTHILHCCGLSSQKCHGLHCCPSLISLPLPQSSTSISTGLFLELSPHSFLAIPHTPQGSLGSRDSQGDLKIMIKNGNSRREGKA